MEVGPRWVCPFVCCFWCRQARCLAQQGETVELEKKHVGVRNSAALGTGDTRRHGAAWRHCTGIDRNVRHRPTGHKPPSQQSKRFALLSGNFVPNRAVACRLCLLDYSCKTRKNAMMRSHEQPMQPNASGSAPDDTFYASTTPRNRTTSLDRPVDVTCIMREYI